MRPMRFGTWVAAILITYTVGFCMFYPRVFTSTDESLYVEQAALFARGTVALTGPYPPGTSVIQAPFVLIGGWRAAAWASLLCMAATVFVLGRWLREAGYSPAFALLFLAYAPTLVMARLGMSDVPSAALVTLGLWLFWTSEQSRWKSFMAGLVAGLSLLFRETNALLFIPFFLSAALRREHHWTLLVAGGLPGVAALLLSYQLQFGSPIFLRGLENGWLLTAAVDTVPIHGIALLVLLPGGLIAVAAYRGRRRGELMAAVALFLSAYVFYDYSGQSTAGVAKLAVTGRYFIPLVPLITLAWADVISRRFRSMVAGDLQVSGSSHVSGSRRVRILVQAAGTSILIGAFAVHPVIDSWNSRDAAVMRDIYANTAVDGALISDDNFGGKYISPVYDPRPRISMTDAPANQLTAVTKRYRSAYIVLVFRSETPLMAELSTLAEDYLALARRHCQLDPVHDQHYGDTRHLRIWKMRSCHS